LILVAMFGPAALFVTRYNRPLGWVWPLPLIMILAAVCALALRRQKRDPDEN
jgi:hypothetical protein